MLILTNRNSPMSRVLCKKCSEVNDPIMEDMKHILMQCGWYNAIREEMERDISQEIGRNEWEQLKRNENNGIKVLLGIEKYNIKVVNITKRYLKEIWQRRKEEGRIVGIGGRGGEHNYM